MRPAFASVPQGGSETEREAPASPAAFDWRSAVREAVIEIDAEGRQTSFTRGRQDALADLADDDGLYIVDRLRASDRVVFLHAHARVRAGERSVEARVAMRLDEAGREWGDAALTLAPLPAPAGHAVVMVSIDAAEGAAEAPADTMASDAMAELAHELRTPLNAISGYAGAMGAELFGPLNERQRDAVRSIETASEHVVEISNAVLDAARFGASARVEPEEGPIDEAVARACALVGNMAARRSVTLANRVTARAGRVPHDGAALRQVLVNLITNAIKASPDGATISIDARRTDDRLEIAVRDGGCGMGPDELATLGTRFARGRRNDGEATGGIGLVLVQRLVEGHGGTLRYESAPGRGTVATVSLPLRQTGTPSLRTVVVPIEARVMPSNDDDRTRAVRTPGGVTAVTGAMDMTG